MNQTEPLYALYCCAFQQGQKKTKLTDTRDTIISLHVPNDVTETTERPGCVLTALCTGVAGFEGALINVWNEKFWTPKFPGKKQNIHPRKWKCKRHCCHQAGVLISASAVANCGSKSTGKGRSRDILKHMLLASTWEHKEDELNWRQAPAKVVINRAGLADSASADCPPVKQP